MEIMEIAVGSESSNLSLLTPDVLHTFNSSLTKLGKEILKKLYHSTPMQQKSLAVSVHVSPTSLSNILSKMEAIVPELLNSQKIGRSKYYSLTAIATSYVASELLPAPSKIRPFSAFSQSVEEVRDTLNILQLFQTKAGNRWDIILDDMLSGKKKENECTEELSDLYTDFVHNVTEIQLSDRRASLQEINSALGQNILISRLQDCVTARLAGYYALKPLFLLEKKNYEAAVLMVDYIFSRRIDASIYDIPELPASFESDVQLTSQQFNDMISQLETMLSDVSTYQGNKMKVIEFWKEKYFTTNHILYYIAEKCCLIYKMRLKQNSDLGRANRFF